MELKIYSKEGNLKLTASPDSNSAATCGIQEESVLALSFTAFECVTLEVYAVSYTHLTLPTIA